MIQMITGVSHIRMLYVQLMYRCNFACKHCFHGELLNAPDSYAATEVEAMLRYFHRTYELEAVTFLGGEPLLYPAIAEVVRTAKFLGLTVEMCTNGHFGFRHRIEDLASYVDKLRISLDGLEATNDHIRQSGSFASALKTIELARHLGIRLGATMTVTASNIEEVVPLAQLLEQVGVQELKLHCLRVIGNAVDHPELLIVDNAQYGTLHERINSANLGIKLQFDADLSQHPSTNRCASMTQRPGQYLDRIEVDPRGGLTMSCKAVGRHAHAFRWDAHQETVVYEPHAEDELNQCIPDVVYQVR